VYGDLTRGEHLEDDNLFANATVDVAEPYGLAKRIAEQLFEYASATRGATGVALRIDSLHVPGIMERRGIHVDDIAKAIHLALTAPLSGFHILNLTADPHRNHAPNDAARALLGWEPDHVFELRPDLEDWTQPMSPPLGALTTTDHRDES
jgi:nucleoside-diphosphate-sugar epimerase